MSRASLALLLALAPAAASAEKPAPEARVTAHTRTLFLPMERSEAGPHADFPIYQWLDLEGQNLLTPGLSLHTSVWGFGTFGEGGDPATKEPFAGDLNLLYLEYNEQKGNLTVRAGRQLVLSAPGSGFFGQMDGGYVRAAAGSFNAEAYGGFVVQERFKNTGQWDWVGGGRAGWHKWSFVNAGVSYFQARSDGSLARELAGVDVAFVPMDHLDLVGTAAMDLVDPGLAESRFMLRGEPLDGLTLGGALVQASPGRLIDKSSIFSTFSLGDYAETEGFAQYAITEQWIVNGRFARVFFTDDDGEGLGGDEANRYGGGVTTRPFPDLWLSLDYDRLPTMENGYSSVRLASRYVPAEHWSLAADLLGYFYDEAPLSREGVATRSLTARLFAERGFFQHLHVGLGGEVSETVLASLDVRGFARVAWELDLVGGK